MGADISYTPSVLLSAFPIATVLLLSPQEARPRLREAGILIGKLPTGKWNAITDVEGVLVGHKTLIRGEEVFTGITVVLPHGGNPCREKVPAAVVVGNGFGKLVGSTQIRELGEIESPIALTNTLNVGKVADALVAWMLGLPGNETLRSVNAVVGETNDGGLNDIRGRHVSEADVFSALEAAKSGPVAMGSVGAGTGTRSFGWKGGIGSSSRRIGDWTLGVLVQSNFGGRLRIAGRELPDSLLPLRKKGQEQGSCMIVLATDAPLLARNLERLARRALAGMARTGASFSNGSGDYVIAFSTAKELRIPARSRKDRVGGPVLRNDRMNPLFQAAADATEEAILDSLFQATTIESRYGRAEALPLKRVLQWWAGGKEGR